MSESTTIARPYARAIFELANDSSDFDRWSDTLSMLASVTGNEAMKELVDDPFADKSRLAEIICAVCGDSLDEQGANMVKVLAEHGRLNVVQEIASRFEALRAEAESVVEAQVESPLPLDQAQLDKLAASLEKHFGKKVKLSSSINKDLMGGVLIPRR